MPSEKVGALTTQYSQIIEKQVTAVQHICVHCFSQNNNDIHHLSKQLKSADNCMHLNKHTGTKEINVKATFSGIKFSDK